MQKLKCLICGMNLNENNYEVNKYALISGNMKNDIMYCPFCGASSIYFSETEEIYTVNPKELSENVLTILDHAVKLEIFNGDFYSEASKLAKNLEVKNMFRDLSKIEYVHAKIHKRLGGFKEFPILTKINYGSYNSDEKLLKLASQREEHAVSYYSKYMKLVNNEVLSKIFKALSEVEKTHIKLTLSSI